MTIANQKKKTEKVQCVVLGAADAGKTSLLRRYFRETFDLGRVPTVGSDYYSKRITIDDVETDDETAPVPVLLQMFDTPGEVQDRRRRPEDEEEQQRHMDALLRAFVGRVDGVMLVYDMTSSTSFGQLRQWHAQWRKHARQNQPILIVGNKRDLIPTTQNPSTPTNGSSAAQQQRQHSVPQRDVMGVEGSFKGNDFRYEYRVDHHQVLSSNSNNNTSTSGMTTPPSTTGFYSNNNSANSLSSPHNNNNNNKRQTKRNHHQISTFSATTDAGILWTQDQDGTYLDSLLTTEDNSNPDRDMVKLWCMRNGLQHVEVSCRAPPDKGDVNTAMETLVQLVFEARRQQQQMEEQQQLNQSTSNGNHHTMSSANNDNGNNNGILDQSTTTDTTTAEEGIYYRGPNKTLDLLERYRPKNDKCCFCFPRLLPKNKGRFV